MTPELALASVACATLTGSILVGLWRFHRFASRIESAVNYLKQEHEQLMIDLAERRGIKLEELPTRLHAAPWWGEG